MVRLAPARGCVTRVDHQLGVAQDHLVADGRVIGDDDYRVAGFDHFARERTKVTA